jgi:hypothetical protein
MMITSHHKGNNSFWTYKKWHGIKHMLWHADGSAQGVQWQVSVAIQIRLCENSEYLE